MYRQAEQNKDYIFRFKLVDATSGLALLAAADTDFSVLIAKEADTSLASVLNTGFNELGFGYYQITLSKTLFDVAKEVLAIVQGANVVPYEATIQVVPSYPQLANEADVCIIKGNIVNLGGIPNGGSAPVVVRGVDFPSRVNGSFISSDKITTNADAYGNFSVALLRGQKASFQIDNAVVKVTITVPDQAEAFLSDLLPA